MSHSKVERAGDNNFVHPTLSRTNIVFTTELIVKQSTLYGIVGSLGTALRFLVSRGA